MVNAYMYQAPGANGQPPPGQAPPTTSPQYSNYQPTPTQAYQNVVSQAQSIPPMSQAAPTNGMAYMSYPPYNMQNMISALPGQDPNMPPQQPYMPGQQPMYQQKAIWFEDLPCSTKNTLGEIQCIVGRSGTYRTPCAVEAEPQQLDQSVIILICFVLVGFRVRPACTAPDAASGPLYGPPRPLTGTYTRNYRTSLRLLGSFFKGRQPGSAAACIAYT
ncbi:hypothetical protein GOODEAATRI_009187, partial [Goodea atripinnis]